MKLKLSRKVFTLVLAVLLGAAMTPCVLHAQSTDTTTTSTSKASSRKAKREARKEARAEKKAAKANAKAENKTAAAPSSAAASTNAAANTSTSAKTSRSRHETASTTQSATPPSPGMVWVNTSTKVYHKAGSKWAGHTKSGKWMSEADAQAAGYKAAKN